MCVEVIVCYISVVFLRHSVCRLTWHCQSAVVLVPCVRQLTAAVEAHLLSLVTPWQQQQCLQPLNDNVHFNSYTTITHSATS